VDKVKDNLYILRGGGGNTAVFIMSDGVAVVDAKNPGYGQAILDEIKKLTPKPVKLLVNTHTHPDHVGSNPDFPATVDIVVQENTKTYMEKMDIFKTSNGRGMPTKTFKDKMTIGKGADQVDIFFFGPGHTGGDTWVSFPAVHAVHAGDIFASKGVPAIDGDSGGSVLHVPETIDKAYKGIKDVEIVINGHTPSPVTMTWDDVKVYGEFLKEFVSWSTAELNAGKSPADVAAAYKVPEKYTAIGYSQPSGNLFGGMAGRMQILANELKKK
jgi:glyoxylase-like metal-dependent hydrolase (beta-lactamase superfamily II)